jgi:hypothetical protein
MFHPKKHGVEKQECCANDAVLQRHTHPYLKKQKHCPISLPCKALIRQNFQAQLSARDWNILGDLNMSSNG